MEKATTIIVPTIFDGNLREKKFREDLQAALTPEGMVYLDFQFQPAVSSPIIGMVLFEMGRHPNRLQFVNVSNYLAETLKTIMGPFADDRVLGAIVDLDDSDTWNNV